MDVFLAPFNFMVDTITLIWELLKSIGEFLFLLPGNILNGAKDFISWCFIPDNNKLVADFGTLQNSFNSKFPSANLDFMGQLTGSVTELEPLSSNTNINIGGVSADVSGLVNTSLYVKYKATFQAWISGFMWVLLGIYNYKQILFAIKGTTFIDTTRGGD